MHPNSYRIKKNKARFLFRLGYEHCKQDKKPAPTSAGPRGAQSPAMEKVESFRAEGGPAGIYLRVLLRAGRSKLSIQLPTQRFGDRIEIELVCFLMQSKSPGSGFHGFLW